MKSKEAIAAIAEEVNISSLVPDPFDGIEVKYDVSRIRLLGKLVRKSKGIGEFGSDEARAFILLHKSELQDRLDKTVRDFLKEKL